MCLFGLIWLNVCLNVFMYVCVYVFNCRDLCHPNKPLAKDLLNLVDSFNLS